MNKVDNCSSATPAIRLPQRLARPKPARQQPAAPTVTGPMAEWIRRAKQLPSVRRDLVDRVKANLGPDGRPAAGLVDDVLGFVGQLAEGVRAARR